MVVLGGLTRLTRSGLSMVEWKPTTITPPTTAEEWQKEFDKYKQFPEYQRLNRGMTLDEFKFIYYMEFIHRLAGRAVGVVFALPFLLFLARRQISAPLGARLALLFGLGGAQGAVGWWMVKSGLEARERPTDAPRVSPYRLCGHLLSAILIYALLLRTGLHLVAPRYSPTAPLPLQRAALAVAALLSLTVASGAFVAGNQAGLIYNEFPLMGGRLVPQDLTDPYFDNAKWRNFFEHSTLVQFDHRVLATLSAAAVLAFWLYSRRFASVMPPAARVVATGMLHLTALQYTLGLLTLLNHVPVSLGSLHQATALALLTAALAQLHFLGPRAANNLPRFMQHYRVADKVREFARQAQMGIASGNVSVSGAAPAAHAVAGAASAKTVHLLKSGDTTP
jgi:cytochrome c oxidase assembly protein subunit 15